MNTAELRVEMIRHNDTGETLAKALGISRTRLSAKANANKAEFTQKEIAEIKDRYDLSAERINEIFFAN